MQQIFTGTFSNRNKAPKMWSSQKGPTRLWHLRSSFYLICSFMVSIYLLFYRVIISQFSSMIYINADLTRAKYQIHCYQKNSTHSLDYVDHLSVVMFWEVLFFHRLLLRPDPSIVTRWCFPMSWLRSVAVFHSNRLSEHARNVYAVPLCLPL